MRKLNTPGVWRHVHYRRWQPTTAGDAVVTATITALDKMPTCCVVDCENRTSSGVKFFRIPAGSHPFQKIDEWLKAIKRADWDNTTIKEARVGSAHFISGNVKVILYHPFLFA